MPKIWLTYAWDDNADGDVDFVAQELELAGLTVKLDRWNLQAGQRLWEQIAHQITQPTETDGWVIYATQNSLGSEPCKEELAYALDRALNQRGDAYPVIGLFPGSVDQNLVPTALRIRLFVSLNDPDWKERIKATFTEIAPVATRHEILPYSLQVHHIQRSGKEAYVIEVRPRAGTWSPFLAAIPLAEKKLLSRKSPVLPGPKGCVPLHYTGALAYVGSKSSDENWWVESVQVEVTTTQSCFIFFNHLPSKLVFGVNWGTPQYTVKLVSGSNFVPV